MEALKLTPIQVKKRDEFLKKLNEGKYKVENLPCLCGETKGTVIGEVDRYGIPLRSVVCKKCGVLRADPYYTEESLNRFYQNDYRELYTVSKEATEDFFKHEVQMGERIKDFLTKHLKINDWSGQVVVEIGCGAGGILFPFHKTGSQVYGCDLGGDYIKYGKKEGMDLRKGDVTTLYNVGKVDIVILNHVIEHFLDPKKELEKISKILKPGGHIFIGVPGLDLHPKIYGSIRKYLQNAHAYNFNLTTLSNFMGRNKFKLVQGYEEILSVFKSVGKSIPEQDVNTGKITMNSWISYHMPFIPNTYHGYVLWRKNLKKSYQTKVRSMYTKLLKYRVFRWLNIPLRYKIKGVNSPLEYLNHKSILNKNLALKDKFKGKRCFIIANGPSIKEQDLSILKNEYTFFVNNSVYTDLYKEMKPSCYVNVDPLDYNWDTFEFGQHKFEGFKNVLSTNKNTIIVAPLEAYKEISEASIFTLSNILFAFQGLKWEKIVNNSFDFSKQIPSSNNVVQMAIMSAMYLGFKEIYLLGVDMTGIFSTYEYSYYKKTDEKFTHFYKPGKEEKKFQDKYIYVEGSNEERFKAYVKLFETFRKIRGVADKKGIKIVNLTRGGGLDVYPREVFEDFMKKNK